MDERMYIFILARRTLWEAGNKRLSVTYGKRKHVLFPVTTKFRRHQ